MLAKGTVTEKETATLCSRKVAYFFAARYFSTVAVHLLIEVMLGNSVEDRAPNFFSIVASTSRRAIESSPIS